MYLDKAVVEDVYEPGELSVLVEKLDLLFHDVFSFEAKAFVVIERKAGRESFFGFCECGE